MSLNVRLSHLSERPAQDPATELFAWQRTLFFRPWFRGAKVVQVGSRDGQYLRFASNFASEAIGFEAVPSWVEAANAKQSSADFRYSRFSDEDYSDADVVFLYETAEECEDIDGLLKSLTSCKGSVVISATNRLHATSPLVPEHCGRWSAEEFRDLILSQFPGKTVQFLHQNAEWPARLLPEFDACALYTIAVIGERGLPKWPTLGLAMPSLNAERVRGAVLGFSRFYPGNIHFAVVSNGSTPDQLEALRGLRDDLPHLIHLIEQPTNTGFGLGCNAGLDWLWQEGWFDLFGVTNDDVNPATDCVCQMVSAFDDLREAGEKPGVIGPVTNQIHGPQEVDIGKYTTFDEMISMAEDWHRKKHSSGTPTDRIRGLFMLIDPDCLSDVGGFDPLFGLGNWEDDDHNLRCRLAGYSLWIADGAFLHHQGSTTFKEIGLAYDATIQRNLELICEKWGVGTVEELFTLSALPENTRLFVPLSSGAISSGHRVRIDGQIVDLVHQATDIEFCAFIYETIRQRPREERLIVLEKLSEEAAKAA